MSMKNSSDTIGIEPSTFRFVARCLNQVRHRVPLERVRDVLTSRPAWQRRTLPITPSYLFENVQVHGVNSWYITHNVRMYVTVGRAGETFAAVISTMYIGYSGSRYLLRISLAHP